MPTLRRAAMTGRARGSPPDRLRRGTFRQVRACTLALLATLLLAACERHGAGVHIVDVYPSVDEHLEVSLRLDLPATVTQGLARGVPLNFRCEFQADGVRSTQRRELRYLPLSRQYQLREPASGYSRSYDSRSAALAALERWPLPLDAGHDGALQLRVYLDRGRLPSPLALSAVFDFDWHLDSGVVTWPAGRH